MKFSEAFAVLQTRCISCHAEHPTDDLFKVAPNGVVMDTPERAKLLAPRIYERAVAQRTMPFLNKTGMPDSEREILGRWVMQGATLAD